MKILFLFLYSFFKAFLPLPSIEAVLIPMSLLYPDERYLYAFVSGIATIGGAYVGYELSYRYGRKIMDKWLDEITMKKQEELMEKYGALAIILGALSPFPDFLLAYMAGFTRMNRFVFLILDGGCRFIRSLLVILLIHQLSYLEYVKEYSSYISIGIIIYYGIKFLIKRKKNLKV